MFVQLDDHTVQLRLDLLFKAFPQSFEVKERDWMHAIHRILIHRFRSDFHPISVIVRLAWEPSETAERKTQQEHKWICFFFWWFRLLHLLIQFVNDKSQWGTPGWWNATIYCPFDISRSFPSDFKQSEFCWISWLPFCRSVGFPFNFSTEDSRVCWKT